MGLGDFFDGVGEGISDVAENIGGAAKNVAKGVAWGATHIDDAARGVGKGLEYAGDYIGDAAKGVGWLATHPAYWDDAAKTMIIDQFTDPVNIATNIAMLGLTVATGGAAAPAWMAKVGLGARAGIEAAEATATAVKIGKGAAEVAEAGKTASTLAKGAKIAEETAGAARTAERVADVATEGRSVSKFAAATERFASKLDEPSMVTRKVQDVREALTGERLSTVSRARQSVADTFLTKTGGLDEGTGVLEYGRQWVGRKIANAPGAPTTGGELAKWNYRAGKLADRVNTAKDLPGNIKTAGEVTKFAANPEKGAMDLAMNHRQEIGTFADQHSSEITAGRERLFGKQNNTPNSTSVEPAAMPSSSISNWQRPDNGGFVATPTSKAQFGSTAVTTVQSSDMPGQVGPSNWYGGQNNYGSGRGFAAKPFGTTPWQKDPALA
jgi:hypothetical protein